MCCSSSDHAVALRESFCECRGLCLCLGSKEFLEDLGDFLAFGSTRYPLIVASLPRRRRSCLKTSPTISTSPLHTANKQLELHHGRSIAAQYSFTNTHHDTYGHNGGHVRPRIPLLRAWLLFRTDSTTVAWSTATAWLLPVRNLAGCHDDLH